MCTSLNALLTLLCTSRAEEFKKEDASSFCRVNTETRVRTIAKVTVSHGLTYGFAPPQLLFAIVGRVSMECPKKDDDKAYAHEEPKTNEAYGYKRFV